jgi:ammonia channel protein AmtB
VLTLDRAFALTLTRDRALALALALTLALALALALRYLACAVILVSIVYPIIIGWGWDSAGFLCANGFVDFAGSCLVHLTGGVAALLGAIVLGPRKHRFMPDGKVGNVEGSVDLDFSFDLANECA